MWVADEGKERLPRGWSVGRTGSAWLPRPSLENGFFPPQPQAQVEGACSSQQQQQHPWTRNTSKEKTPRLKEKGQSTARGGRSASTGLAPRPNQKRLPCWDWVLGAPGRRGSVCRGRVHMEHAVIN